MTAREGPAHDLEEAKKFVRQGRYFPTMRVLQDLLKHGFDEEDIPECFLSLLPTDHYKTVRDDKYSDQLLDVYRPVYCGRRVYLKFGLREHEGRVRVLSFWEDDQQ